MIRVLMLGGTGAIGQSILSIIGNDTNYSIFVTSRQERQSSYKNVKYICGNANDINFINTFEDNSFDVLIDFMNYRNEVLEKNISKLLKIANQYVFLSSARVYDNSQKVIDENCTLLLNTTNDIEFKNSGTYAVKKAFQEMFVQRHGGHKVTIIRPYKTYSSERIQLGEYEIEHWLVRLVNGKPIVVNNEILTKYTSLTDGKDVAMGIISLIGNKSAFGEIYQIVTDECMTWNEILKLYVSELNAYSINPIIYLADNTEEIDKLFESGYQMPYDIKYDRRFNSKKISKIQNITYRKMREGLTSAISKYISEFKVVLYQQTMYDEVVDEFIDNNNLSLWGC